MKKLSVLILLGSLSLHAAEEGKLYSAVINRNFTYLKKNLSSTDQDGSTSLMIAVKMQMNDVIDKLIEFKAPLDKPDKSGNTPLGRACLDGNTQAVKALIKAKSNVNHKNKSKSTALMDASVHGYSDIVRALLDAGAQVDAQNDKGLTALMAAALGGHLEVIELLKGKANPNLTTKDGKTALMIAVEKGKKDIAKTVEALLEFPNINAFAKDSDGKTALDRARENNETPVVQLLEARIVKK